MTRQQAGIVLCSTIIGSLLQVHGGTTVFSSELGEGTKMKLKLPKSQLLASKFEWSIQSCIEYINPPEASAI